MTEHKAIRRHMRDNENRIEAIKKFMETNKGADERECNRNIFILEEVNKALSEIQAYRSIGTVEQCRAAMERQRGKKPIVLVEEPVESEGRLFIAKYFKCLTCGNTSIYFGGLPNNCQNCGQSFESDTP